MLVTSSQMKTIESNAARMGIGYYRLMENAGSAAAVFIKKTFDIAGRNCMVFCGKGNNGGDGLVVARKLYESEANVIVVLTDGPPATAEAKEAFELYRYTGAGIFDYAQERERLPKYLNTVDIVVDAVFGTGFEGEISTRHREIFQIINNAIAAVVSLDIPSGINADLAGARREAVRADFTVVFDSLKPAHVISPCCEQCGTQELVDIGIPEDAHTTIVRTCFHVEQENALASLLPKNPKAHKGNNGKLLNIGGSEGLAGAALLSTRAGLRCGAGYVTLATPRPVYGLLGASLEGATAISLTPTEGGTLGDEAWHELEKRLEGAHAVLLGCGLGRNEETIRFVHRVVESVKCPLLIDADGLNALAGHIHVLKQAGAPVVLTPHPGELARLADKPLEYVLENRVELGMDIATRYNVTVVVKGYQSITISPRAEVYINTSGNAGLGKAGSGDVLAGMIASFLAQGIDPVDSAVCGVFLHGRAGDLAAARLSQYYMQPADILEELPGIFLSRSL